MAAIVYLIIDGANHGRIRRKTRQIMSIMHGHLEELSSTVIRWDDGDLLPHGRDRASPPRYTST